MLLYLFDTIVVTVLEDWLIDREIVRLDSAYCSKLQRLWFLRVLEKSSIVHHGRNHHLYYYGRFEWIASKHMRWKVLVLYDVPETLHILLPSVLNLVRLVAPVSVLEKVMRKHSCRVRHLVVWNDYFTDFNEKKYYDTIGKITSLESIETGTMDIPKECVIHLAQNNPGIQKAVMQNSETVNILIEYCSELQEIECTNFLPSIMTCRRNLKNLVIGTILETNGPAVQCFLTVDSISVGHFQNRNQKSFMFSMNPIKIDITYDPIQVWDAELLVTLCPRLQFLRVPGLENEQIFCKLVEKCRDLKELHLLYHSCQLSAVECLEALTNHGSQISRINIYFKKIHGLADQLVSQWITTAVNGIENFEYVKEFDSNDYDALQLQPRFLTLHFTVSQVCLWLIIRQSPRLRDVKITRQHISIDNFQWMLINCPMLQSLELNRPIELSARHVLCKLSDYTRLKSVTFSTLRDQYKYDATVIRRYSDYIKGWKWFSVPVDDVRCIHEIVSQNSHISSLRMANGIIEIVLM